MTSDPIWKQLAVAFSLASLAFVSVFRRLLFPMGDRYFEIELPTLEMAAVLICVGMVTLPLLGIQLLRDRCNSERVHLELDLLFLALGLMCFGALSGEIVGWWAPAEYEYVHFQLPLAVGLACLLIPREDRSFIARAAANLRSFSLILFPFAVLIGANTIFQMVSLSEGDLAPKTIERYLELPPGRKLPRRVVWVIFDELDESAIRNRPAGVNLEKLDQLLSSSFVATNAFPPNNSTQKSIPSLLTGRQTVMAKPSGVDDLEVSFAENERATGLRETENVFADVKDLGGNSGIVGWYHPYSRLFKKDIDAAYWHADAVTTCFSLSECVSQTMAVAFLSLPFPNPFEEKKPFKFAELFSEARVAGQAERVPDMRSRAAELAGDARLDLVYVHFSFPHAPYFGKRNQLTDSYFDSLELVDSAIREIETSLAVNGLEGETSLIISSDHWWRMKTDADFAHLDEPERAQAIADLRVPFIVKLAGQTQPLEMHRPFNTMVTRYLIPALLKGEVQTNAQLHTWFLQFAAEHPDLVDARPNPNENWWIAGDRR